MMELINMFGLAERLGIIDKERNHSYIKVNGRLKTVFSVTWENDVVNHPIYHEFIDTYMDQVKRTKLRTYEVYRNLETKREELDSALEESWIIYEVRKLFYDDPKMMDILSEILEVKDKRIPEIEKKLNRIGTEELFNKWKKIETDELRKRISAKKKRAMTKLSAIRAFKDKHQRGGSNDQKMTDDELKEMIETLKNPDTIGSFIHYLEGIAEEDDSSRYSRNSMSIKEKQAIQRIAYKLSSLNSKNGVKGIGAANVFFEANDVITENKISLGEYNKYFRKLLNLSVEVKSANNVYLFVRDNIPIRIATNGVYLDGTKETESDALVLSAMRKGTYQAILTDSDKLSKSVENVYLPNRKTSNAKLFALIELISGKKKKQKNDETIERNVIEKIYRKYFAKSPIQYSLSETKDYMYTGVDSVIQSLSNESGEKSEAKKNEKSGVSQTLSEIYVRIDVVDKKTYETTPKSHCKWKEDSVTNELKYLLDMNSLAYLNPSRIYSMAEEIPDVTEKKDTPEKEPDPKQKDEPPREKKGGRSRRIRKHCARRTKHQ